MFDTKILILTSLVYGIVETLEKFGLEKKYAHLLALPLGILGSFVIIPATSIAEYVLHGIYAGLLSVGTCDTLCNIVSSASKKISEKNNKS
jgi:hypothetical protein